MKIEKIKSYITPKTTGYASAAGIGLTLLSGLNKNKTIKRIHKPMAWISTGITLLHIGLIEFYNYKYRNK